MPPTSLEIIPPCDDLILIQNVVDLPLFSNIRYIYWQNFERPDSTSKNSCIVCRAIGVGHVCKLTNKRIEKKFSDGSFVCSETCLSRYDHAKKFCLPPDIFQHRFYSIDCSWLHQKNILRCYMCFVIIRKRENDSYKCPLPKSAVSIIITGEVTTRVVCSEECRLKFSAILSKIYGLQVNPPVIIPNQTIHWFNFQQ